MNYAANASLLIRLICHSSSARDCYHEDTLIKCLSAADEFQIQLQSQSFSTKPRGGSPSVSLLFCFFAKNYFAYESFWLYPEMIGFLSREICHFHYHKSIC